MVKEKFLKIEGYENYAVSNTGRVLSLKKGKTLKTSNTTNGYLKVRLYNGGKGVTKTVHSLVAKSFLGYNDTNLVVNHLDYDKTNNNATNLELVSQRHNVKHSRANKKYSSKHIGVSWYVRNKKWGAAIFAKGNNVFLGLFAEEEKAKEAYDTYLLTLK